GKTLESEWGLALYIESTRGRESRRYLLDFGFTPEVYANNVRLMNIDPAGVDALILSHGHFDHYGGLIGLLEARRPQMRKDLRLLPGGGDPFCHSFFPNPGGPFPDFNVNPPPQLKAVELEPRASEDPILLGGHALPTGVVPGPSLEAVIPQ